MAANQGPAYVPAGTYAGRPAYVPVDDLTALESKLRELDRWGTDLHANRKPDLVARSARVLGRGQTDDIVELALNFQEDLAIMHRGRLEAICFCYPSSWIPSERVGWTLAEIHQPVADGELLRQMSQRIAEVIATKSMRRHVWTISTTGELSNHPKMVKPQCFWLELILAH